MTTTFQTDTLKWEQDSEMCRLHIHGRWLGVTRPMLASFVSALTKALQGRHATVSSPAPRQRRSFTVSPLGTRIEIKIGGGYGNRTYSAEVTKAQAEQHPLAHPLTA
jgi:hypothetical protein